MMNNIPLITIITVSYNAVKTIENTILSVINQSYKRIEYIIIDGGSKDGTIDIIKKYSNSITYWISEPDNGIYDAMNKGIIRATGDWINFMNCGDTFYNSEVLTDIFNNKQYPTADIIYGNSKIISTNNQIYESISNKNIDFLQYEPIYRHGASFVKTEVHKQFLFQLNKIPNIGYALDFDVIYSLYKTGKKFQQVNIFIMCYAEEGMSNHPILNRYYVYKITSNSNFLSKQFIYFIKCIYKYYISKIKKIIIPPIKHLIKK